MTKNLTGRYRQSTISRGMEFRARDGIMPLTMYMDQIWEITKNANFGTMTIFLLFMMDDEPL